MVQLVFGLVLLVTAVAYWPELRGGYVFDDNANILLNNGVHLKSLHWQDLRTAAMSSPSSELRRPLAMLSFGIDWYIAGGKPRQMKDVNLAIHLLNGLLLFALLRRILRRAEAPDADPRRADLLALVVTAAWLLAPINFTAVAYIVQRMESLSQMFVLAGLLGYVAARERMLAGRGGMLAAFASVAAGTGFGYLAKESAALLPLYACIAEWALFGFRDRSGRRDLRIYAGYAIVLVLPGCVGLVWALTNALPAGSWVNRPFTLGERLLTEPRILFDYVRWSLLPTPDALSLYHDQIAVSRGLLNPVSTLASIAGLIFAAVLAIACRRGRPLVALGIGWFLAAHVLTGTIIPLELVFEHRNYFASIGLYLAVFPLLMPVRRGRLAVVRLAACIAPLILFAVVTNVRARQWSDPLVFALGEAKKNPNSPRTAYVLGRTYLILSRYRADSPFLAKAFASLDRAATLPGADALPDQGLLMLYAHTHRDVPEAVWDRLRHKLATQPMSAENASVLYTLAKCSVVDRDCNFSKQEMIETFRAALRHPRPDVHVLSTYANYAFVALHDSTLALDLAKKATALYPHALQPRVNLMMVLWRSGNRDEALNVYRDTVQEIPGAADDLQMRRLAAVLTPEKR